MKDKNSFKLFDAYDCVTGEVYLEKVTRAEVCIFAIQNGFFVVFEEERASSLADKYLEKCIAIEERQY